MAPPPAEQTATTADDDAKVTSRRKRRGRRKGKNKGSASSAGQALTPIDDSRIPPYRDDRVQTIGDGDGTERLSDRKVRQHLGRLEGAFNQCLARAAEATDHDLGRGTISFEIGIEPSGKVWGVSVKAPKHLKVFDLVPCLRKTVYRHRFPSWDGPAMGVDYHFKVE